MEESAANINMVATATEEMNATVNEIAQNAEKAKGVVDQAVQFVFRQPAGLEQYGVDDPHFPKS